MKLISRENTPINTTLLFEDGSIDVDINQLLSFSGFFKSWNQKKLGILPDKSKIDLTNWPVKFGNMFCDIIIKGIHPQFDENSNFLFLDFLDYIDSFCILEMMFYDSFFKEDFFNIGTLFGISYHEVIITDHDAYILNIFEYMEKYEIFLDFCRNKIFFTVISNIQNIEILCLVRNKHRDLYDKFFSDLYTSYPPNKLIPISESEQKYLKNKNQIHRGDNFTYYTKGELKDFTPIEQKNLTYDFYKLHHFDGDNFVFLLNVYNFKLKSKGKFRSKRLILTKIRISSFIPLNAIPQILRFSDKFKNLDEMGGIPFEQQISIRGKIANCPKEFLFINEPGGSSHRINFIDNDTCRESNISIDYGATILPYLHVKTICKATKWTYLNKSIIIKECEIGFLASHKDDNRYIYNVILNFTFFKNQAMREYVYENTYRYVEDICRDEYDYY